MQFDVHVNFLLDVNSLGSCTDVALALAVEVDGAVDLDVDAPTFTPAFDVEADDWPWPL